MKKKIALLLLATMCLTSVTGCANTNTRADKDNKFGTTTEQDEDSDDVDEEENESAAEEINQTGSSGNLLTDIQAKYASAEVDAASQYNDVVYDVPEDYVFEFECNGEAISPKAYEAFQVYDTPDFASLKYPFQYADCDLEGNTLTVRPCSAWTFQDIPEDTITADTSVYSAANYGDSNTWGNLNRLWLVQQYDLTTGEKLSTPIVTPFTVHHDVPSTTVQQKVDEHNNYYLEWKPVDGADAYLVYSMSSSTDADNAIYELVGKTTDTSIDSMDFRRQVKSNRYSELIDQELQDAGYYQEGGLLEAGGYLFLNNELQTNPGAQYAVVVVKDGETSGISNLVNPEPLYDRLPYTVERSMDFHINSVYDLPTYVDVTTVNGNTMQLPIDYHGATGAEDPDNPGTYYLCPHVYNTDFQQLVFKITGLPYEDFKKDAQKIPDRQDELLKTIPTSGAEPEVDVDYVPNRQEEEKTSLQIGADFDLDATPDQKEASVPSTEEEAREDTTVEMNTSESVVASAKSRGSILEQVAAKVNDNLAKIEQHSGVPVNSIIYANSPMEEWIADCLIARSTYIPLPTDMFPEAYNPQEVVDVIYSQYRQNPTSGVLYSISYSYEYQSFIIKYADDTGDRLNKTVKELSKAKKIADAVTGELSNDYDKVLALNNYFCNNAEYDVDSAETDVDFANLTQPFIDAHTPYGILCNNYGVCESYAEAMVLAGRLSGLDVLAEFGVLSGAGNHEWNRVKINGDWCILDITNNDNEMCPNALCNLSDQMAKSVLIPESSVVPSAANNEYEYYHHNGMAAASKKELVSKLREQLSRGSTAMVRYDQPLSQEELGAIAQGLYDEGCNVQQYYMALNIVVLEGAQ